jgi:glutamate synthase (NADPH/NADH) small chain
MDHFYGTGRRLSAAATDKPGRVACIGAGPASLACAAQLRQQGFAVTIFDSRPLAGGLNTYGVAEYKLRPADSLQEVELVRALGVEFRLSAEIGGERRIQELEEQFDIVFLGVGLGRTQPLGIPGEGLTGVIDALRFIAEYKIRGGAKVGRRVVVIGGGNTAIDAATAALRLGAEEVHLLYRRSQTEMPAFEFEYDLAKQEGVQFLWLTQPVAIHGRDSVESVECVRMESGPPDRRGRRQPRQIPDSNFQLPCEMLIPSIGQARLVDFLSQFRDIRLEAGCVAVDPATGQTSNPRYFAGGDCVNGGREVVDAVAEGKRAAAAIARSLEAMHG